MNNKLDPLMHEIKRAEFPPIESEKATGAPFLRGQVDLIRGVKVKVAAFIGDAEITVGKLFDLREGETLALDRPINQSVELQLNGRTVARGDIVVVGDQFGLRITEIPQK